MANARSDPLFIYPPSHSSQAEKGSLIDQLSAGHRQKLGVLKEIAKSLRGLDGIHTFFERSHFYMVLLTLLPKILLLIENAWSSMMPIPQKSLRSTFDRIRDLHVRWTIWHEDAFESGTRVGNWESTEDFKRTTLCGLMLRNFNDVLYGLEGIVFRLLWICGALRFVLPLYI